jgi:hypothetical protein
MPRCRSSFLSRASRAFSSLAVSCVLTLLTLLILALGFLQDTHAEGVNAVVVNAAIPTVMAPEIDRAVRPVVWQSTQSREAITLPWISRRGVSPRSKESPARELFGLSKVAFPLLVSDVVPADASARSEVMSGRTVGVR